MPVFMYDVHGEYIVKTLEEVSLIFATWFGTFVLANSRPRKLLPMSFGPDSLPPPSELPGHGGKE